MLSVIISNTKMICKVKGARSIVSSPVCSRGTDIITTDLAPNVCSFIAQLVNASHRLRGGHGFKTR